MEKKEIFMVVLIGLVLLTVAIQTVQLVNLNGAQVVAAPSSGAVQSQHVAAGPSTPASLGNLPSMVGGC